MISQSAWNEAPNNGKYSGGTNYKCHVVVINLGNTDKPSKISTILKTWLYFHTDSEINHWIYFHLHHCLQSGSVLQKSRMFFSRPVNLELSCRYSLTTVVTQPFQCFWNLNKLRNKLAVKWENMGSLVRWLLSNLILYTDNCLIWQRKYTDKATKTYILHGNN